jgi:hypothetical protein
MVEPASAPFNGKVRNGEEAAGKHQFAAVDKYLDGAFVHQDQDCPGWCLSLPLSSCG